MKNRNTYDMTVLGLLLFNFIILCILSYYRQIGGYGVETDFYGAYASQAKNILDFNPYTYSRCGPGYPLILAIASLIIKDMFKAAIFISIISSTIFLYTTYKTLKILFNKQVGLLTSLFLIVNIAPYPLLASTDMFAAALASSSIFFFIRLQPLTKSNLIFSGMLTGYAYITRYSYLYLLLGISFSIILINPFKETYYIRSKKVSQYLFGFILTSSPWLFINYFQNGSPFYNTNYSQIASTFYGVPGDTSGRGVIIMKNKFSSLKETFLYNPKIIYIKYIKNIVKYVIKYCTLIIKFPAYLFVGPGVLLLCKNLKRKQLVYLVICGFGYLILCLVWFVPRFHLSIYPLLFLFIAIYFCHEFSKNIDLSKKILISMCVILLLISLFSQIRLYRRTLLHEPRALYDVSEFIMKREKDLKFGMISRKPHLPHLCGVKNKFPLIQRMTIEEFVRFADKHNIKYILYTDEDARISPILKVFENPEKVGPSIKNIYESKDDYLGKIILYTTNI